jgi:murein DD-endopeptidase MepM/ murein hydrolase activator NlpD
MAIIKGDTAKVQKGDTLSSIAKATGSTVAAIAKANNIADVNLIRPGQLFTIPAKKTGGTPDSAVTETPTVTPVIEPTITKTVVSTYIDPPSGDTYSVYSDGSTGLLAKGTKAADALLEENRLKLQAQRETANIEAQNRASRQSAYDLLNTEFERYGLASLVTPLKDLITSGVSPSEFTLKLRETDAYKNRFAANQARIKNGLRALSEAEYIRNEDAYQEVMRRRGLPASYYEQTVDPVTGITKQKGFETLLAGDVSSTELEDRIVTAQDRVINANPEIAATLKQFYPGISNGDILAYTLDPANAINEIKRKVTAAEIGATAGTYGLGATASRAEQLAAAGVTESTAQQGFKTISQIAPRAEMLSQVYNQSPYTQETAEREFFGLAGAGEAEKERKRLTSLETAAFSGSAGAGVIARDRAGVI